MWEWLVTIAEKIGAAVTEVFAEGVAGDAAAGAAGAAVETGGAAAGGASAIVEGGTGAVAEGAAPKAVEVGAAIGDSAIAANTQPVAVAEGTIFQQPIAEGSSLLEGVSDLLSATGTGGGGGDKSSPTQGVTDEVPSEAIDKTVGTSKLGGMVQSGLRNSVAPPGIINMDPKAGVAAVTDVGGFGPHGAGGEASSLGNAPGLAVEPRARVPAPDTGGFRTGAPGEGPSLAGADPSLPYTPGPDTPTEGGFRFEGEEGDLSKFLKRGATSLAERNPLGRIFLSAQEGAAGGGGFAGGFTEGSLQALDEFGSAALSKPPAQAPALPVDRIDQEAENTARIASIRRLLNA